MRKPKKILPPGTIEHKDYYTVHVPTDFSRDPEERANVGFNLAEERTRVYHSPCTWRVVWDNPDTGLMKICRTWVGPRSIRRQSI